MARITSAILQKIAPQTKAELRDRFLPYLNEALPRYGIVNELQVAAFLATAAFESQYFQKTKEGKARASSPIWIKYQSKYWHTNFMGRGIFQTTHLKNYRTFGQKMKAKGLVTDSEMFVKNPELLEQPKWAVESACEYWETNGLDKYARQGFKGFSALQGRVNKGSAEKVAHDYPNRLIVYERTRLALPDDFSLIDSPVAVQPSLDSEQPLISPTTSAQPDQQPSQNPSEQPANITTTETVTTGTPPNTTTVTEVTQSNDKVVIEDREKQGFFATIKKKIIGKVGADMSIAVATEKAQQMQVLGLSPETWQKIFYLFVAAGVIWLLYEAYQYYMRVTEQTKKTEMLVTANSTPTNRVEIANTDVLQEYKAKGYTVITR